MKKKLTEIHGLELVNYAQGDSRHNQTRPQNRSYEKKFK